MSDDDDIPLEDEVPDVEEYSSGDTDSSSEDDNSDNEFQSPAFHGSTNKNTNTYVKIKVVQPDDRITDNRLHKAEAAAAIGMRAEQIAQSGNAFVKTDGLDDAIKIAYKEFYSRMNPLVVKREIGIDNDGCILVEKWSVREMSIPQLPEP